MFDDRFDLLRFVEAQNSNGTYLTALTELRAGHKRGHWIWFVFPQLAGLGSSPTSQRFAVSSLEEAAAYFEHPVLGTRLIDCAQALLELPGRDPRAVIGEIDALKLRSSMTLFAQVPSTGPAFAGVLERYYAGEPDPAAERRLADPDRQN